MSRTQEGTLVNPFSPISIPEIGLSDSRLNVPLVQGESKIKFLRDSYDVPQVTATIFMDILCSIKK